MDINWVANEKKFKQIKYQGKELICLSEIIYKDCKHLLKPTINIKKAEYISLIHGLPYMSYIDIKVKLNTILSCCGLHDYIANKYPIILEKRVCDLQKYREIFVKRDIKSILITLNLDKFIYDSQIGDYKGYIDYRCETMINIDRIIALKISEEN